jgi:hypothetical protein
MKRKHRKSSKDNNATWRHRPGITEQTGLPADGSIRTYTPEEWEPMGLQADGSIKIYTSEEWKRLEAALRIGSFAPDEWEQAKAVMRFKWQRGYDDAMAGLLMPERALYEYFDGYDAGKAKLSANSALSRK